MNKLKLNELTIQSFTTSEKSRMKAGAVGGGTEHRIACPETEALRSCINNCM
ncbi:MAG: pinensin family lanthipeptide [Cyclobacteriaceae bacterium]